jgi:hypothetical protein
MIRHIPGGNTDSNIFTKNMTVAVFKHHFSHYVGHDEDMQVQEQA